MVFWLFLLKIAVLALQVHAQSSRADFVSIDCGIASNSSYVDQVTGISYVSDDQYVDTGSIRAIDQNYKNFVSSQFQNVRSFPDQNRSCYTLPLVKYQRYLIRASFLYGNYDHKNRANVVKPLQFDLYLGINFWRTMIITDASIFYVAEALSLAATNFTWICLMNTGNGEPFISAIELRPLKNSMYNISESDLDISYRVNFGPLNDKILRYPDDPYDRFWFTQKIASTTNISTNSRVDSQDGYFEAPSAVLQTAITPTNAMILTFHFDSNSVDEEFYHILHFTEVERLTGNSTRIFDIFRNNDRRSANYTPPYLSSGYVYSTAPFSGYTQYNYSLNATNDSTLPPIINAIEVCSVIKDTGVPTDLNDVYALNFIKKQYLLKRNWMGDPCFPSQYIWDGLQCTYDGNSYRITSLNLSSSGLIGAISSSFAGLTNLTYLDLSNNNLTGAIPDALGNMLSLKVLILSCNNLTGSIPASLSQRSNNGELTLRYDNTANACAKSSENSESSSKSKISKPIIAVVSVVPAVLLLSVVVFIVWKIRKVQALGSNSSVPPPAYPVPPHRGDRLQQKSDHIADHQIQAEMKQFTHEELAYVTRNFESVIGQGGFGVVYHGTLHDGKQVAVKMLSHSSQQGTKEFLAEAQNLARIHHRNLVSLVGYCNEGKYLGLVYEYMSQGSLREHLKEYAGHRALHWEERLRVAVEAAQGLEYLHKGCNPPIIHRDVKTANILLNKDMEAKLADFGLSKAFHNDRNRTHVSTQGVVGTPGYLDPEYQNTLMLNEKSDVYSFGVVLMELITGQSPIIPGTGNIHIAQRVARSIERGYIDDIVDRRLHGEYDVNSVWKICDLSLKCTAPRGSQRPSMSEVVLQLKETLDLAPATTTTSGKSENYNSIVYMSPSAR